MSALVIVFLMVIAVFVGIPALRTTMTGRRAGQDHQRALSRLGEISHHREAESAVGVTDLARTQSHVRLLTPDSGEVVESHPVMTRPGSPEVRVRRGRRSVRHAPALAVRGSAGSTGHVGLPPYVGTSKERYLGPDVIDLREVPVGARHQGPGTGGDLGLQPVDGGVAYLPHSQVAPAHVDQRSGVVVTTPERSTPEG